jgi:hypothetical protein
MGGTGTTGGETGATTATPTGSSDPSGASTGATGTGSASVGDTTDVPTTAPTSTDSGATDATATDASATDASASTGASTGDTGVGTSGTGGDDTTGAVSASTGSSGTGDSSSSSGDDTTGAVSASSSTGVDPECQGDADCPAPGECMLASCTAGVCGEQPAPVGAPCGLGQCDGGGQCLECLADADCASGVCNAGACADAACDDGVKNGDESDVDCGGGCEGCELGEGCGAPADCLSGACSAGVCVAPGPLCAQQPADPVTGQRCPLFMACTQSAECGEFVGCQQWFCNNAKTCELNAKVDCWTNKGGGCNADVVFTQQTLPPVDKRFVPPDNVSFREVASLAFTIKNNTATDLYLDKLPLALDLMGGGSKFDISSVKIFDNSGGTEHGGGDILVCLTADPFSFPANGVMGPCGGSAFSKILKGQSNQFIVNVAFAKEKTFIAGRSYRLRLDSTAGIVMKAGFNGPAFQGTTCGVPVGGYVGAWVTAQNP